MHRHYLVMKHTSCLWHRFLPEATQIIGYARSQLSAAELHQRIKPFLKGDDKVVEDFLSSIMYVQGRVHDDVWLLATVRVALPSVALDSDMLLLMHRSSQCLTRLVRPLQAVMRDGKASKNCRVRCSRSSQRDPKQIL